MNRSFHSLLAVVGLVLAAPAAGAAALTAESVKVYKSTRGEEVVVVMLKPQSDNKAVIRITGSSSLLDGMALPYQRSLDEGREYFTTDWRGRGFSFVQSHDRGAHWELYIPGDLRHPHPIVYNDAQSHSTQASAILALHESQLKDGSLQRFAAFNRAAEQADQEKELRESVAETEKACGARFPFRVVWSTVSDEVLKKYAIATHCATPFEEMATLCKASKVAGTLLAEKVKELSCSFAKATTFTLTAGKLEWKLDPEASNPGIFAKKQLTALEIKQPVAANKGSEQTPWGDMHTLGQRVLLSQTGVCTDGKNHYVVSTPRTSESAHLYYGDGKQFTKVELAENLGSGDFFEPRYQNPTASSNHRGHDLRLFSTVDFDAEKQTCSVRCGTRRTELKILPAAAAAELLAAASYLPPRNQYVPHALTRDDRGNYYYVDKGSTPETEKRFRLFVGPKGGLKLQRMTNVVSDSQGEIFSTKDGELRFIVGPQGKSSTWVKGNNRTTLLALEIEENWRMIWNDLGVYAGERRSTPCDDM